MSIKYKNRGEWEAEGRKRFGDDIKKWAFVCPVCGFVARVEDWLEADAPVSTLGFSCVGRWSGAKRSALGGAGEGPCTYAGGGLFQLNPVQIGDDELTYFDFASKEAVDKLEQEENYHGQDDHSK